MINLFLVISLAVILIVSIALLQRHQQYLDNYTNEKLTLSTLDSLVTDTENRLIMTIFLQSDSIIEILGASENFQSAFDSFYSALANRNSISELSIAGEYDPIVTVLRADIVETISLYKDGQVQLAQYYYTTRVSGRIHQLKRFTVDELYFVDQRISQQRSFINKLKYLVLAVITIITISIGGVVFWLGQRSTRAIASPLKQMKEAIQAIAMGQYGYETIVDTGDEFEELADTLNTMSNDISIRNQQLLESITLYEEGEQKLRYLANYDALTELPNRRLFTETVEHALLLAQRNDRTVAIMYIDLDKFKQINDSLGHSVGDQLLIIVAGRLKGLIRKTDTLARLGGDEFTLLLEDVHAKESVVELAQKILNELSQVVEIDNRQLAISCCIGISFYPQDAQTPEDLLKNADAAMYSVKNNGGNAFQFYMPSMNARALERLTLKNDLSHALEHDELFLVYQPKHSLCHKGHNSAEALIRWKHPTRGLLHPDEFIDIAEESGLIVPIGHWVLQTVCEKMMYWQQCHNKHIKMAVNVSTKQFCASDFISDVQAILSQTGLQPEYLELELTESLLMDTETSGINTLTRLKSLGITLSIDDFGTGYSSLQYLSKFPIDLLKIDRSFVAGITHESKSQTIVRAIIAMGKGLGLQVIAEGVEEQEQADLLRRLGCDIAQGYLYSRPLNEHAFLRYFNSPAALLPFKFVEA